MGFIGQLGLPKDLQVLYRGQKTSRFRRKKTLQTIEDIHVLYRRKMFTKSSIGDRRSSCLLSAIKDLQVPEDRGRPRDTLYTIQDLQILYILRKPSRVRPSVNYRRCKTSRISIDNIRPQGLLQTIKDLQNLCYRYRQIEVLLIF